MAETIAKYHHLIPQVYRSAWAQGSGTLKVEFVDNREVIVQRNKENIAGITNFHSIQAGMPLCKQSDTDLFFAPLKPSFQSGAQRRDGLQRRECHYLCLQHNAFHDPRRRAGKNGLTSWKSS